MIKYIERWALKRVGRREDEKLIAMQSSTSGTDRSPAPEPYLGAPPCEPDCVGCEIERLYPPATPAEIAAIRKAAGCTHVGPCGCFTK